MTTAVNALYLAESIGQMAESGISIANRWNLANGVAANGTDYGLVDADTFEPYPAYYGLAAWQDFGEELLVVSVGFDPTVLSVYAGRSDDGTIRLVVVNKTQTAVAAGIDAVGHDATTPVVAHTVRAATIDSTELELDEPVESTLAGPWAFPPWSITSLTVGPTR